MLKEEYKDKVQVLNSEIKTLNLEIDLRLEKLKELYKEFLKITEIVENAKTS